MQTLDYAAQNPIPKSVNVGAILAEVFELTNSTDTLAKGELVKLDAGGTISAIAAATDIPLGVINNSNPYDEGGYTVNTFAKMHVWGTAGAAITAGVPLAVTGSTNNVSNFAPAGAGDFAVGIALADVANGAGVLVAIFETPYKHS